MKRKNKWPTSGSQKWLHESYDIWKTLSRDLFSVELLIEALFRFSFTLSVSLNFEEKGSLNLLRKRMYLLLQLRQGLFRTYGDAGVDSYLFYCFVFNRKNEREIIEIVIKHWIKLCTLCQSSAYFCNGVNSGVWVNPFTRKIT